MRQTYTFSRDGKNEDVQIERWAWCAVYKDGRQLKQFGDDGVFHQVGEIEQDKVKMFTLYKPEDENKRIDLIVQPGMRLVHLYRNVKPFYSERFIRVYIMGYKLNNKHHYNFILPDDRIIQSSIANIDLVNFELTR